MAGLTGQTANMLDPAKKEGTTTEEPPKPAEEPPKPATSRSKTDSKRAMDYIDDLKSQPEDSPFKKGLKCFCKYGVKPLILVCMFYIWIIKKLYFVYTLLPINLINMIFGLGLCFFGGMYYASIAAVEAAINLGGVDMWEHLQECWDEASLVTAASLEDDKVDANKDDIPDVQQMSMNELISHKAKISMMAVKDPMKLQKAVVYLTNVWVAVVATLKFQFARTVAIALGIGNMITLPMNRLLGPFLSSIMGADLNHWVPAIIDTSIKVIMVVVAGMIQAFISAFYSGMRGGKIFANAFFNILDERGCWAKLPDRFVPKPYDPDMTFIDEAIAYPLAAAGVYFQVSHAFMLPFPFSVIMFPLDVVEWIIRFQIFT